MESDLRRASVALARALRRLPVSRYAPATAVVAGAVACTTLAGCGRASDAPAAAARTPAAERSVPGPDTSKGASDGTALPRDILRGLNTDARVLACFSAPGKAVEIRPESFRVARRDLDDDGDEDWVVSAVDDCLRGDFGRTWVYAESDGGRRLLQVAESDGALFDHALQGRWTPLSKVYFSVESVRIDETTVAWGECGAVRFALLHNGGGEHVTRFRVSSPCRFLGDALQLVELKAGSQSCRLEVSLFDSEDQALRDQAHTWGVFEKRDCTVGN